MTSEKGKHHHCGHHHHHHHHHHDFDGSSESLKRMWQVFLLNLTFAVIELIGGIFFNSVAVVSDALHDFGDAAAIGSAIFLEKYSRKGSDVSYSYGYRRFSTLSAILLGMVLIIGSLFILIESIPRLMNPSAPNVDGMLFLALLGIAVNGFAAYRASRGKSHNERMITWHMIEDVIGWILVLFGALAMKMWNIPQIDAGLACILSLWILYNVFKNLSETFKVFLQAVPETINVREIEEQIKKLPNILGVHHTHLWSLDGEKHIFTCHVVISKSVHIQDVDDIKNQVKNLVRSFSILEATIEIEFDTSHCIDPEHN